LAWICVYFEPAVGQGLVTGLPFGIQFATAGAASCLCESCSIRLQACGGKQAVFPICFSSLVELKALQVI